MIVSVYDDLNGWLTVRTTALSGIMKFVVQCKWVSVEHWTILEQGWAKYCDLSLASRSTINITSQRRSIISQSWGKMINNNNYYCSARCWQIMINYSAITKFNSCLSFDHCSFDQLKMSNHSLIARGIYVPFSHKNVVLIMHALSRI